MPARTVAQIDVELAELHKRHEAACDQLFSLLTQIAAMEYRQDVLLERRLAMEAAQ